jgi:hypothetical protein
VSETRPLLTVNITDATLTFRPELAMAQRATEASEAPASGAHEVAGSGGAGQDGGAPDDADSAGPPPIRRYFRTKRLQADRHASDHRSQQRPV